jgi:SAM-dependent methyltransferase
MKQFLKRLKAGSETLNYGREIIAQWAGEIASARSSRTTPFRVLDIGAGYGADLQNIAAELKLRHIPFELYGLDSFPDSTMALKKQGVSVADCNIENQIFPYEDGFFDLIVANQVIEHTKEIFWIFSEISRILKPGAKVITGVPNIASFHNRVGMLFGMQPTNIELLGPHVRGFTAGSFVKFIETDGYFKNCTVRGSNFYPLPSVLARFMARIFPRAAVSIFLLTERTPRVGLFKDVLKLRFFETPFFIGKATASAPAIQNILETPNP